MGSERIEMENTAQSRRGVAGANTAGPASEPSPPLAPAPLLPAALALEPAWSELVTGWLAQYHEATAVAYRGDLVAWIRFAISAGLAMETAGPGDIAAWARALEETGARPATVSRKLAALSSFYRYAVWEDLVPRSPMDRVRRPKVVSDYQPLGLDHDQAKALLATAKTAGPRDHALVCLLLLNGLRVSEACGACTGDLGDARGHRTLRIARKGGAESVVPLAHRTAEAVRGAVAERTSGPILLDWEGHPLDRFDAARASRRLGRQAGIGPVHPHALRHAFVTLALDGGATLRDVQDAAGHADPRTTRRYDRSRHNLDRHPTYALSGSLDAIEDPT